MNRMLLFATALLAAACVRETPETVPAGDLIAKTFRARAELPVTRTSLNAENGIVWSASDQITIFSETGKAGQTFSVASTAEDGTVATFSGLTTESANGYYYALYPAQDDAVLVSTGGTLNAVLPSSQAGVSGSFADGTNLSVARVNAEAGSAEDILHFRNVGALLAFQVPSNYLTKARIASRDGSVAMTGGANIKYNNGAPVVSATSTSKNYVEVTGLENQLGKIFYAVVYPGEYRDGFEVSFINSGNTYTTYVSTKALDLKRNGNVLLINKNWGNPDDLASRPEGVTRLITPVISSCAQASATSARIAFSCSSGKKTGFNLYRRDAASMGEGTLVATVEDASATSYTFTGLTTGASYDFGVSAICSEAGYGESEIAWADDVTINASVSSMSVSVSSVAETYYNFIVNYTVAGLSDTGAEHGLVFSYTDENPTCGSVGAEGKLPGPVPSSTGTVSIRQCVPNSILRPGEACRVRAYCFDEAAGNYVYSPVSTLILEAQPSGFSVQSQEVDSPSEAIDIYSFTADGLNGYYAVADCSESSPVRLGVWNAPLGAASASSLTSQGTASGAWVLINGQIFGSQGNIGLSYDGGELRYNNSSGDGIAACRGYSNTYTTTWQPVTRAILGVDASGTPGAFWCSLIGGVPYFFDRPIPAGTAGELVYPQVSASSGPGPVRSWSPEAALSTGPMLLYGGNVCVSEDRIATGIYYTNYELWETTSGNIYGSSRPRTAVGYDSVSGKVYLVVLDKSSTATHTRMARIMKGLGCDYAMNLDGGGSSQMYVSGSGLLLPGDGRSVKSTLGFFAR